MSRCKLLLIEGVPGSGKSTQAAFIKRLLDDKRLPNRLYREGDLDHPADFESVAHFMRPEYETFVSRHASYRHLLEHNVTVRGDDCFLHYRTLKLQDGQLIPDDLIDELSKHDVYKTPFAATYRRLAADRWQAFVQTAALGNEFLIFECCFLQNPLTVLLGKHNVTAQDAIEHIQAVAGAIQSLQPALIYLYQQDTRAALERIAGERPQEWQDFVTAYFTQQGWGKAAGISGFDGVIAFYDMRKMLELDLLPQLGITHLLVDNSHYDWAAVQQKIAAFVDAAVTNN